MGSKKSKKSRPYQKILTVLILLFFGFVIYLSMSRISNHQVDPSGNMNLRVRQVEKKPVPEIFYRKDRPIASKPIDTSTTGSVAVFSTSAPKAQVLPSTPVATVPTAQPADTVVNDAFDTVLLVVASPNRPDYLKKTLSTVLKYHPRNSIPILISEDGSSPQVQSVISDIRQKFRGQSHASIPFVHVHNPSAGLRAENGYFALSRHFKWALGKAFSGDWMDSSKEIHAKRIIILEEDLEIAPDFFDLFTALTPLLESDPNLLTISAWNDNGLSKFVADEKQVYRSDFFPGLGWMMTRNLWEEWGPKWPDAYWDDWIREPPQRRGRHILRPEVCRTFHFGKNGVSKQQFHVFIDDIKLNTVPVDFSLLDLGYLEEKEWDETYMRKIKNARRINPTNFRAGDYAPYTELRVEYDSLTDGLSSFPVIARRFGIMDNIKAGVPRTAYKGIVSFWYNEVLKIHIVPTQLMSAI